MTNHRSNLLNQHTWMAQSKRSVFANCTGWECVSVSHRGREVRGKKRKRAIQSKQSQREIHFPVCMTTSLQGHQKQIRCRSKWPREIVSGNSRGQSADLSGGKAGRRRRAIELIQIYIVENSIWPSRSSNHFRFTRHQSNLFVGAHQDVKPGLTYCNTNPICPFSGTRANRGVRQSGSSPTPPRLNDKINTHTSGLPFITHTNTQHSRKPNWTLWYNPGCI